MKRAPNAQGGESRDPARCRNGRRHRRAAGGVRPAARAEHAGAIAAGRRGRSPQRRPRHVVFTARGTSDHAALYGAYLTEIRLGIPAGLASPSRDHRLRRPPRPARRAGHRGQPERRLARPDRGGPGRPRVRARSPSPSPTTPDSPLAAGRRAARRRRRRARAGGRRHQDLHRRAARAAAARRGRPGRRRHAAGRRAGRAGPRCPSSPTGVLADPTAGRARRALPVRRPARHHRPRVRLPDRPRGGAEAHGDVLPGRRSRSPAPTCCTARWR